MWNSEENRTNSFRAKIFERIEFWRRRTKTLRKKTGNSPTLNTKFSVVSTQKELKLMWFVKDILLDISVKWLRDLNAERGEISRILFEVCDFELFESHTVSNYLFWNENDETCHNQLNYSILVMSSRGQSKRPDLGQIGWIWTFLDQWASATGPKVKIVYKWQVQAMCDLL